MSKKYWIIISIPLLAIIFLTAKHFNNKVNHRQSAVQLEEKNKSYWTCPMHPQIHQDHPGECPICHMKLVKVSKPTEDDVSSDNRVPIQGTSSQLSLIGIQKHEVEKMDLVSSIPVSGRILSASSVAVQVYEKDLRYVTPGLSFNGEASNISEEEISGIISSVDTIVDPTSRTVRVIGSIRQGPRGLLAETSFSGAIQIELKNRPAIPESSVLHTGKDDLVYVFGEKNQLTAKPVKLGLKTEGFYEVLDGLSPGDLISSGPNFLIDSEAKIRGAARDINAASNSGAETGPNEGKSHGQSHH